MSDWRLKYIFGEIKKIAPAVRLTEMEYKCQLANQACGRLDGSLKNLSGAEFIAIKRKLHADAKAANIIPAATTTTSANPMNNADDTMRKKVISLMRQIGYEVYDHELGRMVADMHGIYAFVKLKGVANPKGLNEYTHNELVKLVTQVEMIHQKKISNVLKK